MMADDEIPATPASLSATRTPLEGDPALLDPAAAAVLVRDDATGAAGTLDVSARAIRREHLRQLLKSKAFIIGMAILLWWVVCAVFGRVIAPYDPVTGSLTQFNMPPSSAHWFGTDSLGRDVFSRVIVGARDILIIAPLATLLGTVVGTSLGLIQGYFRGVLDNVIGRIVDAVLALPFVIIAFLFVVAVGPSTITLILVIGLVFALILPNVLPPILVEFTVRLGYAIFAIATLSFLGFGIQPPTPDWGADIAASYQYLAAGYWWETLFPALAIASLIVAVNLIGDSIEAVVIQ